MLDTGGAPGPLPAARRPHEQVRVHRQQGRVGGRPAGAHVPERARERQEQGAVPLPDDGSVRELRADALRAEALTLPVKRV